MKRLVPYRRYELGEIEDWLEREAAEGRHLVKWGAMFVKFEEGEPGNVRYCVDADDMRGEPNWERKTENEEKGWQYVCTMGEYLHIYKGSGDSAPMPDAKELRKTAAGKYRRNGYLSIALVFIYVALLVWFAPNIKYPIPDIMQKTRFQMFFYCVIFPGLPVAWVVEIVFVMKTAKVIIGGEKTIKPRRPRRISPGLSAILNVLIWVMLIAVNVYEDQDRYQNVGEVYPPLPFVDLTMLEGENFELSMIGSSKDPSVNMANRLEHTQVMFAADHYSTSQIGSYEDSTANFVSLEGEYWRIRPGFISETLMDQLIEKYTRYGGWSIEEQDLAGFSRLTVARMENSIIIVAGNSEYVICLEYEGSQNMDRLIVELAALFGEEKVENL